MGHARRRITRRVTRLAAVGGLLLGSTLVGRAVAGEPAGPAGAAPRPAAAAGSAGAGLVERLGAARTAGSWIDGEGRPVVAVTDGRAAAEVRRAGATAKVVEHSLDDLRSATAALRAAPRVAGTAWGVDYRANEVVLRGDPTVSAARWAGLKELAAGLGAPVRMERTRDAFTTRLNGARPILSTAGRCSAGFNVTDGRSDFILTAGHCGPAGTVWFTGSGGGRELGRTVRGSFPGDDYALVSYAGGRAGEGADVVDVGGGRGVRITGVSEPSVGQRVFRSGSTSGLRDGVVRAVDMTVNYPEGSVSGLIETDVCAEPGDSGGPLFSEGIALGITSGGSGDCTSGGTTYFEPVTGALRALGVKLITAGQPAGAAAPQPSATGSAGGAAPGDTSPGASAPVNGEQVATLLSRLADPRNVGPGLLIVAGSLVALVATRFIRVEQDRQAYRRFYSATWN